MPIDPLVRLLNKCEWDGSCLVWTGTKARQYGLFRASTKACEPKVYVHRYSYSRFVGPIPEGLELDHVVQRGCRSKLCILPWHLEPVTHQENRKRGRLDTCRRGLHDLTKPANVRWDPQGNRRGCLCCWNDAQQRRK